MHMAWKHAFIITYDTYFVECGSKIRHILSVIHYTIRGAVCLQFTHYLVMIERIYIYFVLLSSSNRKYELLPIV